MLALSLGWAGLALSGCYSEIPPAGALQVELATAELAYPQWHKLRLRFTANREGSGEDLYVFVHLVDHTGAVVRTFDQPLGARWRTGAEIPLEILLYQSALAPPLAPGSYDLVLGLYDLGGERTSLEVESTIGREAFSDLEEVGDQEYRVATLEVPPLGAEAPALAFDPAWSAPEPGADQQILGRRWLTGEGKIEIANLEVPGSLWLRLQIPTADPELARVVPYEEGTPEGTTPKVEITSTCGDQVWTFSGPGPHGGILPVHGTGESATCELTISPNYVILFLDSLERRSAVLDLLALTPAEL